MRFDKQHPYIHLSMEMQTLLPSLQSLGVTHFNYLKNYSSGIQINLSTDPKWINDYYSLKLYESSRFELSLPKAQKIFLWSSFDGANVTCHGRNYFKTDYGITLYSYNNNHQEEFYFFSGNAAENKQEFFLNHLELFEHFILFFQSKFFKVIEKIANHPKAINKKNFLGLHEQNSLKNDYFFSPEQKKQFFQQTKIRRLCWKNDLEVQFLSPRQTDCLKELLRHKTVSEISVLQNLSVRTTEKYIDTIKNKLNCISKAELLEKIAYLRTLL